MYETKVPYKNFKGDPKTKNVQLSLTEREIFKLSPEFTQMFNWRDELKGDPRDLDPQEVIPYFTAFEEVLLTAWGELSADGEHFRKGGRYDFEESACFNALLMMFVQDPGLVVKFLEAIVPEGMEERLKEQAKNIEKLEEAHPEVAAGNDGGQSLAELQAELAQLRTQINQPPAPPVED